MADPRNTASSDVVLPLPFDPPLPPPIPDLAPVVRGRISLGSPVDGLAMSTVNPETGRAHLMYVSESLAAMLGRQPTDLLGSSPDRLFATDTPIEQLSAVADVVERGDQAIVDLSLQHRDGRIVPVQASFLLVPSLTGQAPHFLGLYRRRHADGSPRRSVDTGSVLDTITLGSELDTLVAQVAERIAESIPGAETWVVATDGVGLVDPLHRHGRPHHLVTEVARFITESGRFVGPDRADDGPRSWSIDDLPVEIAGELDDVTSIWSVPLRPQRHRGAGAPPPWGVMLVVHRERVEPHPTEVRFLRQLGRVLTVAYERSRAEASLAHQALHDPLTQLPNRALILDRLEQAVARLGRDNHRLAVLLVDLDRFRSVNARIGPTRGDEVLVEVSRRLRRSVRLGDTVGRIGGDQFLVLCVAMNDDADAEAMAQRSLDAIARPIPIADGDQLSMSASIGVVLIDRPGVSPASVISSAESALARAVEKGRGGYAVYEKGWEHKVLIRHEVEQALEVAIDADELVLYYQPIVEIEERRIVGAEALIRWDRPGFGLLPPVEFIEIAEETGLILPVGDWIIDDVCRRLSAWEGSRIPRISINLSARQLAEPSLTSTVLAALERHDVAPDQLGFEVTESMRVDDLERATETLRNLASIGCRIAIDDFGIGYATLDYLKRFSMADTIKIDRSFVDGLGTHREDTAIVTASIALATSLGLTVVAEGVETSAQFERLAELGCAFAQGFGLSPPVPLEQFVDLWDAEHLEPVDHGSRTDTD